MAVEKLVAHQEREKVMHMQGLSKSFNHADFTFVK